MSQKMKLSGKVVTKSTTKPPVKIYEKPADEFELKVRLLALKHKYGSVGNTYEETAKLMNTEFKCNVTAKQLQDLDEADLYQEELDRRLVWEMQNSR